MRHVAKVLRSGNSHAIRLPKAFRFDLDEVEVAREGDRGFRPDFMAGGREEPEE